MIGIIALVLGYPYHLSYLGIDLGMVDLIHVGKALVYLSLVFSMASAAQYVRALRRRRRGQGAAGEDWRVGAWKGRTGIQGGSVGACARNVEELSVRHRQETVLRGLPITGTWSMLVRVARAALLATPLLFATDCSNQGEGERCTLFGGGDAAVNGTSECSSGLVCTATGYFTTSVSMPGVGTLGVCCPPSGTPSTAAACNHTTGGSTTGGPPVGDGGFDALVDGAVDAKARDAAADGHKAGDAHASKDAHPSSEASHAVDAHGEGSASAAKDAATDAPKDTGKGGSSACSPSPRSWRTDRRRCS